MDILPSKTRTDGSNPCGPVSENCLLMTRFTDEYKELEKWVFCIFLPLEIESINRIKGINANLVTR